MAFCGRDLIRKGILFKKVVDDLKRQISAQQDDVIVSFIFTGMLILVNYLPRRSELNIKTQHMI